MLKKIGLIGAIFIFIFILFDVYIIYRHPWIRTYNTTPHPGGNLVIEIITWTMFFLIFIQTIFWIILSYSDLIFKQSDRRFEIKVKITYIIMAVLFWLNILYVTIGFSNSVTFHIYAYICILQLSFGLLGILLAIISILGLMIIPNKNNS